jgi:hypothetical protein
VQGSADTVGNGATTHHKIEFLRHGRFSGLAGVYLNPLYLKTVPIRIADH